MRGIRLPIIALALAALLFAATLFYRVSLPAPAPAPTLQASASPDTVPTPLVTAAIPTFTPESTAPDAQPAAPATYREGLIGTVQRLNPLLASLNPVDEDLSALIFEGLTAINQYGEPMPALAERWIISSDGLEYVVFLRDDVLWQDGVPFGAADVLYTMSLLRSPDFPGDC
ncbi:MAG TPA: ABC transporter substrate-binding protein, partial [Candidatus Limnocylindrales bacterium]|nr:ABC transporter substrate-binding protein [Candidatus Limnocylindrales bacterium]